ncbi:MAG: hypothetical protein US50_C0008G0007 [Candidatus Nomurabacteria bacterium GW2011_GWB1_37_5]|uniref:TrbC/VIRB2 family protein n=1 Tax=Candidatus Nomurabacteria bacterium GW2011_GWB1_37_5 TaxID=1618742 RepID=A0A0G0K4W4_9BACT|nr:MAG: hypothetical protein US50_C0008G0007 [Candidatus Nomurabacteria bacterium GW2011_GWB1_37_5]
MKLYSKIISIFILSLFIFFPLVSFAQLVPNCPTDGCGWNELITLTDNIINFLLFKLTLPIAAVAFAYAGYLYMTSGGSEKVRGKAKDVFLNVFYGLMIAVAAFVIVKAILLGLGVDQVDPNFILVE